jgi:hypothetical protein
MAAAETARKAHITRRGAANRVMSHNERIPWARRHHQPIGAAAFEPVSQCDAGRCAAIWPPACSPAAGCSTSRRPDRDRRVGARSRIVAVLRRASTAGSVTPRWGLKKGLARPVWQDSCGNATLRGVDPERAFRPLRAEARCSSPGLRCAGRCIVESCLLCGACVRRNGGSARGVYRHHGLPRGAGRARPRLHRESRLLDARSASSRAAREHSRRGTTGARVPASSARLGLDNPVCL